MNMEKITTKPLKPKLYDILKNFDGVNYGQRRHFNAGEQALALDADLAAVTVRKGWAREVNPCAS